MKSSAITAAILAFAAPALAQPPKTGPDMSLEAITPEAEAIDVGLAGSDPADIARYLLARARWRRRLVA